MPTDENVRSRRRREVRWLLLVLVSVLLTVGLGALLFRGTGQGNESAAEHTAPPPSSSGSPQPPGGQGDADVRSNLPDRLRSELAAHVAKELEQASPVEHADHGHHFAEEGKVICVVDPFGVDPPEAEAVAEVERAYVLHMCVAARPGVSWDFSSRSSGPLVYTPGKQPAIEGPSPDRNYSEQVRELIPPRYHEHAFGTFADLDALTELRERFNAVVTD